MKLNDWQRGMVIAHIIGIAGAWASFGHLELLDKLEEAMTFELTKDKGGILTRLNDKS